MAHRVVEVRDLRVQYPDGRVVAVGGMPFVAEAGERVAVLGPNGSGKSTLLRTILGLARATSGEVEVLGRNPSKDFGGLRLQVSAVLQDVEAQLLAPTVGLDLAFGLAGRGLTPGEISARVDRIARAFELGSLLDRVPHYLSGGERRKVALAGALVTEPALLVLDEPFAGLDPTARRELAALIRTEHERRGLTLVLTTHEVQEIPDLVDVIYLLSDTGEVVARGAPDEIFARPELLAASNIEPPPLASLVAALAARGEHLPHTSDPNELAAALVAWRDAAAVPARRPQEGAVR